MSVKAEIDAHYIIDSLYNKKMRVILILQLYIFTIPSIFS